MTIQMPAIHNEVLVYIKSLQGKTVTQKKVAEDLCMEPNQASMSIRFLHSNGLIEQDESTRGWRLPRSNLKTVWLSKPWRKDLEYGYSPTLRDHARQLWDLASQLETLGTNPAREPKEVDNLVFQADRLLQEIRRAHG